jgi:hypothetical protein
MSYERLAYDDPATVAEMTADCRAVEEALHLPARPTAGERARRAAVRPAPSLRYEDCPREAGKPAIAVSDAAARLGAALHLHLD